MSDQPDLFASLVQEERPGLARRLHPQTAKDAARAVAPKTGTQRWRALVAVADALDGLTSFEAAVALRHNRPHVIGTRLIELRQVGLVERNGATRPTDTGNQAEVYVATELGRQVLEVGTQTEEAS